MKLITKYCSRKRGYKRDFRTAHCNQWILHGDWATLFPATVYTVKHRLRYTHKLETYTVSVRERHRNRNCKTHGHFQAPLHDSLPFPSTIFQSINPKGEKAKKVSTNNNNRCILLRSFPSFSLRSVNGSRREKGTTVPSVGRSTFRPLSILRNEKKKKKKQETRKSAETRVSSPAYVYDA